MLNCCGFGFKTEIKANGPRVKSCFYFDRKDPGSFIFLSRYYFDQRIQSNEYSRTCRYYTAPKFIHTTLDNIYGSKKGLHIKVDFPLVYRNKKTIQDCSINIKSSEPRFFASTNSNQREKNEIFNGGDRRDSATFHFFSSKIPSILDNGHIKKNSNPVCLSKVLTIYKRTYGTRRGIDGIGISKRNSDTFVPGPTRLSEKYDKLVPRNLQMQTRAIEPVNLEIMPEKQLGFKSQNKLFDKVKKDVQKKRLLAKELEELKRDPFVDNYLENLKKGEGDSFERAIEILNESVSSMSLEQRKEIASKYSSEFTSEEEKFYIDLLESALTKWNAVEYNKAFIEMITSGTHIGIATLPSLIKASYIFHYEADQLDALEEIFKKITSPYTIEVYEEIMMYYNYKNEYELATNYWNLLLEKNLKPRPRTLKIAMEIEIGQGRFLDALKLEKEIVKDYGIKFDADLDALNMLIIYSKSNKSDALEIYEKIISGNYNGVMPNNFLFSTIMNINFWEDNYEACKKNFQQIFDSGLYPDCENFETIFLIAHEYDDFAGMKSYLKQMISSGFVPSYIMMLTIMYYLQRRDRIETMEKIYAYALASDFIPNDDVINCVVTGLALRSNNPDRAFAHVIYACDKYKYLPDINIYNILLFSYLNKGLLEHMVDLYKRLLIREKLKPNLITFTLMINGYLQHEYVSEVLSMLENPEIHGLSSKNVYLFDDVVEKLKARKIEDAVEILNVFPWELLFGMEERKEEIKWVLKVFQDRELQEETDDKRKNNFKDQYP